MVLQNTTVPDLNSWIRNTLIDAKFQLTLWDKNIWLSTSYAPTNTSSPPQIVFDEKKPPTHVKDILERFKLSASGNRLIFVIIEVPYIQDANTKDPGLKVVKTEALSQRTKKKAKQNTNAKAIKEESPENGDDFWEKFIKEVNDGAEDDGPIKLEKQSIDGTEQVIEHEKKV
jgi:hypothetical protein